MTWLEASDGALVNLDHIAGFYVRQEQSQAPNDDPPHVLFAFTPAGAPTVIARGPREELVGILESKIRPLLGRIELLRSPIPPDRDTPSRVGAPSPPGQYL
ncbi:MAG: hypothetical protein ACRDH8_15420 [Actinomycetota bacterium]